MLTDIIAFLERKRWKYQTAQDNASILIMGFETDTAHYRSILEINESSKIILFLTYLPMLIPESARLAMAMKINQINNNLFLGNLEMDNEDGSIRFRTNLLCGNDTPTFEMLLQLINENLGTTDILQSTIQDLLHNLDSTL